MRSAAKTISIEKIYPLMGVFGGVAVNVKGVLTVGWELKLPVTYSKTEEEYDDMMEIFSRSARILPPWSVVHRQDVFVRESYGEDDENDGVHGYLADDRKAYFRGRRYLTHRAYLFVSLCNRAYVDKKGTESGFFGFPGMADPPTTEQLDAFLAKCEEFRSNLKSSGYYDARMLTDADWVGDPATGDTGIIQRYLMLSQKDRMLSEIKYTADSVNVFDRTAYAFVLAESKNLPNIASSVSKIDALSNIHGAVYLSSGSKIGVCLDCEHIVNQILVIPEQSVFTGELNREKREMSGGIKSVDNRLNSEEIGEFLDEQYRDGRTGVKFHTNVIAWCRDGEQMDLIGKVSSALTSMDCIPVFNKHNTPPLWYACCPSCAFEIGRESLMRQDLMAALCFGTYETFDEGMGKGSVMTLCDRMRNIPVGIDFQKIARKLGWIHNPNIVLIGSSGSGKSFFTNLMLRERYNHGQSVMIIDKGDSYEIPCAIINEETGGRDGQYFTWDNEHPLTFNPFGDYRDWLNDEGVLRQDENGVNLMMSFLQTVWKPAGGWTSDQIPVLRQMLNDFVITAKEKGLENPVLNDFHEYISEEIAPKIRYTGLTEKDIEKQRIQEAVSEWKRKQKKGKDAEVPEGVMQRLELEVQAQMTQDKREISDRIFEDAKEKGYCIGRSVVTSRVFDIEALLRAMEPYVGNGSFAFLLNDPTPKDLFSSRFIVYEMDTLESVNDDAFKSIVILFITHTFDRKMRKDTSIPKTLVLEEAWKHIANEQMAPYLKELWKTSRKFSATAMVVSQEMADITSSEVVKDTIFQNSSIKLILDQSTNKNFDQESLELNLSDKSRNLIRSINKQTNPYAPKSKDIYIQLEDNYSAVLTVEASPKEAVAYESAKDKKDAIKAFYAATHSYRETIDHFVELRKSEK